MDGERRAGSGSGSDHGSGHGSGSKKRKARSDTEKCNAFNAFICAWLLAMADAPELPLPCVEARLFAAWVAHQPMPAFANNTMAVRASHSPLQPPPPPPLPARAMPHRSHQPSNHPPRSRPRSPNSQLEKFNSTNRPTHALFEAFAAACAAQGVLVVATANDEGHVEIARAEPGLARPPLGFLRLNGKESHKAYVSSVLAAFGVPMFHRGRQSSATSTPWTTRRPR